MEYNLSERLMMRRERVEAAVVGVALLGVVAFLCLGFILAVGYGVAWMLS